jgi:hypothetical protein
MIRKLLNHLLWRRIAGESESAETLPVIDTAPPQAAETHDHAWSDYEGTPI